MVRAGIIMPDSENGKVTLALVGQKLDLLINRLDKLEDNLDGYIKTSDYKCQEVKLDLERVKERQISRDEDIADLKKKSETWSIINSIVGAIAFLIATIAADLGLRK